MNKEKEVKEAKRKYGLQILLKTSLIFFGSILIVFGFFWAITNAPWILMVIGGAFIFVSLYTILY